MMLFACLTAPSAGGATGVADAAAVLDALPRGLVERFEREGWVLARNYNEEIGASVADAFGTDDPRAVEAYCRANAIDFQWQPDGGLRTWQRRAAVVTARRHRAALLVQPDRVPQRMDDGSRRAGLPRRDLRAAGPAVHHPVRQRRAVGPGIVELIGDAYAAHTMREAWRPGDLMLVDNLRCAHSRDAFEGQRRGTRRDGRCPCGCRACRGGEAA